MGELWGVYCEFKVQSNSYIHHCPISFDIMLYWDFFNKKQLQLDNRENS